MKFFNNAATVLALIMIISFQSRAQKNKTPLHLKNAVVIGMIDNQEDRYSIEINMTDLLASRGIKAVPSINLVKTGADTRILAQDSMMNEVKAKGFDTYVLITVRGYDKRFKLTGSNISFAEAMEAGTLYKLYQPDIVSISFEIKFYRDGVCVHKEMVKCGNVGSRDSVIKKFRSKIGKLIDKKWK